MDELLGADGLDLFVLDFDFDAEGRANIAALDDGAANPDIAGKIDRAQRVIESAAAGIADQWMCGLAIVVIDAQLVEIGDVLELAVAVGSFAGERPVAGDGGGRAARKTNDGGGNIFSGEFIANEKIGGGPGFGELMNVGNGRMRFVGVREQGIGIGCGRRNFNLRSGLLANSLFGGPGVIEPTSCQEQDNAENYDADNQGQKRIAAAETGRGTRDTRDVRHVWLKALR